MAHGANAHGCKEVFTNTTASAEFWHERRLQDCEDSRESEFCGKVVKRKMCASEVYQMRCRRSCGGCDLPEAGSAPAPICADGESAVSMCVSPEHSLSLALDQKAVDGIHLPNSNSSNSSSSTPSPTAPVVAFGPMLVTPPATAAPTAAPIGGEGDIEDIEEKVEVTPLPPLVT